MEFPDGPPGCLRLFFPAMCPRWEGRPRGGRKEGRPPTQGWTGVSCEGCGAKACGEKEFAGVWSFAAVCLRHNQTPSAASNLFTDDSKQHFEEARP